MALTMSNALVGTGLVAKPAVRSVQARAGLKVFARMTKDRVSLKKDTKLAKEERTRLSILVIKEDLAQPETTLRWSPTHLMVADSMTKSDSNAKCHLLELMSGAWEWSEATEQELLDQLKPLHGAFVR